MLFLFELVWLLNPKDILEWLNKQYQINISSFFMLYVSHFNMFIFCFYIIGVTWMEKKYI